MASREQNPICRLYEDIIRIVDSMVIKMSVEADKYETLESKSAGDRYIAAVEGIDTFPIYDDYTEDDYIQVGIKDRAMLDACLANRMNTPSGYRGALLRIRRQREIDNYVEKNNYYRMLNGLPDLDDTDYVYASKEIAEKYGFDPSIPVHALTDHYQNSYYSILLEQVGYLDKLKEQYPDKKYLEYIGVKRISISSARRSKNFSLLYANQDAVMESTYREFVRSYEKARVYFITTQYVYEYRNLVPYYDNFIGLCIFIMAIQQVSMRSIQNAVEREFYDEYMVRLLFETYGLPYYTKIDDATQKSIIQNINLLIQNKATDKVILDISNLLGFTDVTIYQYYLLRKRRFDSKGRPLIIKKNEVNPRTGKIEEVYDYEAMYSVYFQKVELGEENYKSQLTNQLNRIEYNNLTYYDPMWWEDSELKKEIWETEYNFMETKYFGMSTPYKLTDILFQSVILLRMILENDMLSDVTITLPKITEKAVPLTEVVVLFLALLAKKYHLDGTILYSPSKIVHAIEVCEQDIHKEEKPSEVLGFNFAALRGENLQKTIDILKEHLTRRQYRVVNGHDVDLRDDGTQDTAGPTHLVQYTINTADIDLIYDCLKVLEIPNSTPSEKVKALNKMYENTEALYYFLSYLMSNTSDYDEYCAIKKFYDTVFYTTELRDVFKVTDEDGNTEVAETFLEYFRYKDKDLYTFIKNVEQDTIYTYIDHIIYKLSDLVNNVGYLYVMNDGFSPLVELLEILIKFFKSYFIDLVEMSSVIVINWDFENVVRMFDVIEHENKWSELNDPYPVSFMDVLYHINVNQMISDDTHWSDDLNYDITVTVEDFIPPWEEEAIIHAWLYPEEQLNIRDTVTSENKTIVIEDELNFQETLDVRFGEYASYREIRIS